MDVSVSMTLLNARRSALPEFSLPTPPTPKWIDGRIHPADNDFDVGGAGLLESAVNAQFGAGAYGNTHFIRVSDTSTDAAGATLYNGAANGWKFTAPDPADPLRVLAMFTDDAGVLKWRSSTQRDPETTVYYRFYVVTQVGEFWRAVARSGVISATSPADAVTITPIAGLIEASATTVEQGEGVHFKLNQDGIDLLISDTGLSDFQAAREAEYYWSCQTDNYTYDVLPADTLTPVTAGGGAGAFWSHVFDDTGTHTVTLTLFHPSAGMYTTSIDVTVNVRNDSLRTVGVLTADASAYTTATTLTPDFTYADLDAALAALQAGTIDTLLLRRGQSYTVTRQTDVPDGAVIDAFDTGARPIITPTLGAGGIETYAASSILIDATGNGTATAFTDVALPTNTYTRINTLGDGTTTVFSLPLTDEGANEPEGSGDPQLIGDVATVTVGGVTQTEGVDYTRSANTFTFTTAPANGAAVVVTDQKSFHVYLDDVRQVEGTDWTRSGNTVTFTTAPGSGARVLALRLGNSLRGDLITQNTNLLRIGTNTRIRNLDIRGPFNAAAPGTFDSDDLGTFEHAIHFDAISLRPNATDCSVFGVEIRGIRSGFIGVNGPSNRLFVANCKVTDWFNYGFYADGWLRIALLGCDIRQNTAALNGPGGKGENVPGRPNYPDHGPIRCPLSYEQVVNRCRLASYNSWSNTEVAEPSWQPIARLAASDIRGQSYAWAENHTEGGSRVFGSGVPNNSVTLGRGGLIHAQNNFSVLHGAGSGSLFSAAGINNIWYHVGRRDEARDLVVYQSASSNFVTDPDVLTDGLYLRNETVIVPDFVLTEPGLKFTYAETNVLANAGLHSQVQVISRGANANGSDDVQGPYVVPANSATITVPVRALASQYFDNIDARWRLWRAATSDESTAVAESTVSGQGHPEVPESPPLAAVVGKYEITQDQTQVDDVTALTITAQDVADNFTAGEHIWITRERCLEGRLLISADGSTTTPDPVDPETFPVNNRVVPLEVAASTIHNLMLVIDGTRDEYRITDKDAPLANIALYRSATHQHGPISELAQPETGSTAIDAGTVASLRDFLSNDRGDTSDLGAIEAASDASGLSLDALLVPPTVSVAVAVASIPITTGTTLDETDIDLTISPAGVPALTAGDVSLFYQVIPNGGSTPNALVAATTGVTVSEGDSLRVVARWSHPVSGFQQVEGAYATVTGAVFTPALITNQDGVNWAGYDSFSGFTQAETGPSHAAVRFRYLEHNGSSTSGIINAVPQQLQVRGGASTAGDIRFRVDLDAGGDVLYDETSDADAFGALSLGVDYAWLMSCYPAGATTADAARGWSIGDTVRVARHDGDTGLWHYFAANPVIPANSGLQSLLFTGAPARIVIHQAIAIFNGGEPNETHFFDSDGTVQHWSANPSRGIAGMTPTFMLDGLNQFNNPALGTAEGTFVNDAYSFSVI